MYISTDYNKTVPEQAKQAFDKVLAELINDYEAQIQKLKARADDTIPTIRTDVKDCSQFGNFGDPSYTEDRDSRYSYGKKSVEEVEKEYAANLDKARAEVEVLEDIIEEMGLNICDTLLLGSQENVNEYIWDCLYGNSTVESFVKFYNKELENESKK